MRLWAKQIIPLLPREQLIGQYRELCAIAANLANEGTPNHLLVNKILDYSIEHLYTYAVLVRKEMTLRKIVTRDDVWNNFINNLKIFCGYDNFIEIDYDRLYDNWMTKEYLIQCLTNLKEKYDCGGIELIDWFKIINGVRGLNILSQEEFDFAFDSK